MGVVVVWVCYVDPKKVRVAALAGGSKYLQGLALCNDVPGHAVEGRLGFDRQQLAAGFAVLLLQGGLERGERGAGVLRVAVV